MQIPSLARMAKVFRGALKSHGAQTIAFAIATAREINRMKWRSWDDIMTNCFTGETARLM